MVDVVRGEPEFENRLIEDFVIQRGDGSATFILANVVDDMDIRVSLVVRAEEHLSNTPKAQLLWEALGGGEPPTWAHVPVWSTRSARSCRSGATRLPSRAPGRGLPRRRHAQLPHDARLGAAG